MGIVSGLIISESPKSNAPFADRGPLGYVPLLMPGPLVYRVEGPEPPYELRHQGAERARANPLKIDRG